MREKGAVQSRSSDFGYPPTPFANFALTCRAGVVAGLAERAEVRRLKTKVWPEADGLDVVDVRGRRAAAFGLADW